MAKRNRDQLFKVAPHVWQAIVDGFKPYYDEDGNKLLWALSKLNNLEKHRFLITTFYRAVSSADLIANLNNFQFVNNLFVIDRAGEHPLVSSEKEIILKEDTLQMELLLKEPNVVAPAPLIDLLKVFGDLVHQVIEALEALTLADHEVP